MYSISINPADHALVTGKGGIKIGPYRAKFESGEDQEMGYFEDTPVLIFQEEITPTLSTEEKKDLWGTINNKLLPWGE